MIILLFAAFQAIGQTRNTAKAKEFPLPLNFDVIGNGVQMLPLEFHYDLSSSDGRELILGNLKIDAQSFYINVVPVSKANSYFSKVSPMAKAKDWVFLFQWPDKIIPQGTLEMITRTGRVIWSTKVEDRQLSKWQSIQNTWRDHLLRSRVSRDEIAKQMVFNMPFGLRNAQSQTPFWKLKEPFRFCVSHTEEQGLTRLCSPFFEVLRKKGQLQISLFPLAESSPRVILKNEEGPLSGTLAVELEKPFQFFAELRSGYSFEFVSVPRKVNVIDMVQDSNPDNAYVTIESNLPPLATTTLLNKQEVPEWVEWVGWQQTIGDFRKFWRTKIQVKDAFLMVPGIGGGAFRQKFEIEKLPKEESRPYLNFRTIKGTYVDGAPVRGRKIPKVNLSSKQNSVDSEGDGKEDFVWSFGATRRGEMNRSYLLVNHGENTFPAYHEIYKGYPGEVSTRVSGILGSEGDISAMKITIMSEVALNYWFESLFGWENYHLSRQRWGASAKAFRSLTELEISKRTAPLQVYTGEIKYRLNPGLWARDESWGVLSGYQHVTFDQFNAQMWGVGAFWARSMPKVFDDIMAWFKFLDYPKWVDMEFIFYPVSLTPQTVLGRQGLGNWALNFHGQIMFTQRFFMEGGFGLKTYDFGLAKQVSSRSPNLTFTSSYGTIGFGFKF